MNAYKQDLIDQLHVLLANLQKMQAEPETSMLAISQTTRLISYLCDRLDLIEYEESKGRSS